MDTPTPSWLHHLSLPRQLHRWAEESLLETAGCWRVIDDIVWTNQWRVLNAFRRARVCEEDFYDSSGYGYHDRGRERLEEVYAAVFETEAALVRPQIVSGTHALTLGLFGLLRPGDGVLFLTGAPYDTLQAVVGSRGEEEGTLQEWGISHHYLEQDEQGYPDLSRLDPSIPARVIYVQRSAGYDLQRRSLDLPRLREIIAGARKVFPEAWVMVDNCYGEFVDSSEPVAVGADLVAGSLIKNPGGGLACGGGYLAGKESLIRRVAACLTAPGLYGGLGAVTGKRLLFQGLFYAPVLTGNALKSAVFAAALFEKMGYKTIPRFDQARGDIVQVIELGSQEKILRFCRAIQEYSPVDSHLTPEADHLPGYREKVVMAAGTFIQGATSELSADAPMRPPFAVFLQGGFTLPHAIAATCRAAAALM